MLTTREESNFCYQEKWDSEANISVIRSEEISTCGNDSAGFAGIETLDWDSFTAFSVGELEITEFAEVKSGPGT